MNEIDNPYQKNLPELFKKTAFVEAVLAQLAREFEKVGIVFSIKFESLVSFEEFCAQLVAELDVLAQNDTRRFSQLLYLIDLPENKVAEIFNTSENPLFNLATLILLRVGQKVYFREKYKHD